MKSKKKTAKPKPQTEEIDSKKVCSYRCEAETDSFIKDYQKREEIASAGAALDEIVMEFENNTKFIERLTNEYTEHKAKALEQQNSLQSEIDRLKREKAEIENASNIAHQELTHERSSADRLRSEVNQLTSELLSQKNKPAGVTLAANQAVLTFNEEQIKRIARVRRMLTSAGKQFATNEPGEVVHVAIEQLTDFIDQMHTVAKQFSKFDDGGK